jgi:small conductance mechanosensitive channel
MWLSLIVVFAGWAVVIPPAAAPAVAGDSRPPTPAATETGDEALRALQERLKTVTAAYRQLQKDLAPRLAEAQAAIQQASAALGKTTQPARAQQLEEELRLAEEWRALLEEQLALAGQEVRAVEGLLQVEQGHQSLPLERSQLEGDLKTKSFTAHDAKVATAEAKLAADKAAVAQGRVEALQADLLSLEKEAAELRLAGARADQEASGLEAQMATPPAGEDRAQLERQRQLARRRAAIAQKKAELAQQQLALTRMLYELAQRDQGLLAARAEMLDGWATAIRDKVGVSLDDLRSDQEEAAAAQRAAEIQKQQAQREQEQARQEQGKAQAALEQAKTARERATTAAQLRLAELNQQLAEKQAELAQKKSAVAKEKIEVAGLAAEIAQKRLELTTRKLEIERKTLTAAEILNGYELAKAEGARVTKAAQSARANAELARRETEALKREAELAALKAQAEKRQAERLGMDALARHTVQALESLAQVAEERGAAAEEWANLLEDRARLATERLQIAQELQQLFGKHRATYHLWKREPSKIRWTALEEVYTDVVIARSALLIGISTLPAQLAALPDTLLQPTRYWAGLRAGLLAALCFGAAALGGVLVRRRLQPAIVRQEAWFLPSLRRKLWRAGTRLLHAAVLPASLALAGLVVLRLVVAGSSFFAAVVVAMAATAAYRLLHGLIQELFMPWNPPQRLLNCREGVAAFFYHHLHRIVLYVAVGLATIQVLRVLEYREGLIALLRLLFDVGLLGQFILLAANKEAIVGLLPRAENRFEKLLFVGITWVYPLLVLVLICIVALFNLGYVNLARFLAISCALTALILAAAHLLAKGLDRLLRWWFLARPRPEAAGLFSQETRQTVWRVCTHGLSSLVYVAAVAVIAGLWGIDLSGVYASLTAETAQDYYRRLLAVAAIIAVSVIFLRAAYYLIDRLFTLSAEEVRSWRRKLAFGDKGRTIAPLLKSALKYCTIFMGGVMALRTLGVDPTPIIAGAGVVGLAVGFGAQTLVKDVIAGFFLLFEGLIAVGDVINFGNTSGVVEEVGLRVTKYRTFSGELWVIPNGEIRAFGNFNRQWMRAVVPVGVAYEQDIGKAMHVLEEVGRRWAEEHRDIVLEPPQVQGILSFDDSAISLRLVIKVKPLQQWAAEWELRRRVKEAFDREGIEIPFPRRVVYTRRDAGEVGDGDLSLVSKRMHKVEADRPPSAAERAPGQAL